MVGKEFVLVIMTLLPLGDIMAKLSGRLVLPIVMQTQASAPVI